MGKRKAKEAKMSDRSDRDKRSRKGKPSLFKLQHVFADGDAAFSYLVGKGVFDKPVCESCGMAMEKRKESFFFVAIRVGAK